MLVLSSATTFCPDFLGHCRHINSIMQKYHSINHYRHHTDRILDDPFWVLLGTHIEKNVMFRLARESIFTDRSSIPHWPFFFTSSADCPPMTRPTFSHPSLPSSPNPAGNPSARAHPPTLTHTQTIGHLMPTDSLPNTTAASYRATDRIIVIAGFQLACLTTHHTGRIRVPALPTGCLSIPPHSACSSCLSPATSQTLCQSRPAL